MAKANYSDLLKDPQWQKKRLEILSRDNFRCCQCGSLKNTLHVHHQYYIKGNMPWEYPNDSLITLCEFCHEAVNNYDWKTAFLNLRLTPQQLLELATCTKHFLSNKENQYALHPDAKYKYTPEFDFMTPWVSVITQEDMDDYYHNFRNDWQTPFING